MEPLAQIPEHIPDFPGAALLARLERWALGVSMVSLALMGALVTLSILGRWLFALPVPDDVLMAELLMVGVVMLPLGWVQSRGGHIRIILFTSKISHKFSAILDLGGNLIGLIFLTLLVIGAADALAEDIAGEHYYQGLLMLPSWPFMSVFLIGVVLIQIRLMVEIVLQLVGLVRSGIGQSLR